MAMASLLLFAGTHIEICERVSLTQRDVLLQELDVASFARVLAGFRLASGGRPRCREVTAHGASDCQTGAIREHAQYSLSCCRRRDASSPFFSTCF